MIAPRHPSAFCSSTSSEPNAAVTQSARNQPSQHQCTYRQRTQRTLNRRPWQSLRFALIVSILFCCRGAPATESFFAQPFQQRTDLIFDRSEPPAQPMRLHARQESTTPSTSHSDASSSTSPPSSISTAPPSTDSSSLPKPFDSSLGNNFTTPSCPAFFHSFLSNATFNQCLPFSLLLQTSNAFFATTQSLFRLTRTLDATCAVDLPTCTTLMASLARQIQSPNTCGHDLSLQNPMVQQAYAGLIAYEPLYHAACLTSPGSAAADAGTYCFAAAVTNASAPSSSYIYYLPLGVGLPANARLACTPCLQNTMAVFAAAAGNSSQPLNGDYAAAARQIDDTCGSTFVEATVRTTSAAVAGGGWSLLIAMLSVFLAIVSVVW